MKKNGLPFPLLRAKLRAVTTALENEGKTTGQQGGAACRKAAENGDADAQYELGRMYDAGLGVKQSDTKAVE